MKQYIVDIKGVCILEDEWKDTTITITRNGIADTIEFDKSDIVKTEEIGVKTINPNNLTVIIK